jgi:hypothetical protein
VRCQVSANPPQRKPFTPVRQFSMVSSLLLPKLIHLQARSICPSTLSDSLPKGKNFLSTFSRKLIASSLDNF